MIVADASALVDLLLGRDVARTAVRRALIAAAPVHAPDIVTLEVASAVLGVARSGALTGPEARDVLGAYAELPVTRHASHPLLGRVVDLAARLSVYDAAYVALAEGLGVPLLTTDRRLARSVKTIDVVVPA